MDKKLKIKDLAKSLGRHQSTISRWFNGTRNISKNDAAELERLTGIDRRAWLWPDEFPNPLLDEDSNESTGLPAPARLAANE